MQAEKYVRESYTVDPLRADLAGVRSIAFAVLAGIVLMLVGLRVLPEDATPLTVKVLSLLSGSIVCGAFGAYAGRNLNGWGAIIGLALATIIGMFVVSMFASSVLGMPLLLGWGFLVGMSLGPLVSAVLVEEGHGIILQALLGTSGIMLLTGLYTMLTGADFRFVGKYYFIAVLALVVVGVIGLFVRFSRKVNMMYSLAGIGIFSVGLLYKFSVMARDENTWRAAVSNALGLYLSFVNLFTYVLQFLLSNKRR